MSVLLLFQGATAFTATSTDAVGILDSKVQDLGHDVSDAVGIVDSRVQDLNRDVADAVGIGDSKVQDLGHGEVTDVIGIVDSTIQDVGRDVTDVVGIVDSKVQDDVSDITGVIGIVDSQVQVQDLSRDVSDAVGILDPKIWVQDLDRDEIGVADGVTADVTSSTVVSQTRTDATGLVDAVMVDASREIIELVALMDAIAPVGTAERSPAEVVGVSDDFLIELADLVIEGIAVSDEVTVLLDSVAVETVGVEDDLGVVVSIEQTAVEVLGTLDTVTATTTYDVVTDDALAISDGLGFAEFAVQLTESISVADGASKLSHTVVVVTNPLVLLDALHGGGLRLRRVLQEIAIATVRQHLGVGTPVQRVSVDLLVERTDIGAAITRSDA